MDPAPTPATIKFGPYLVDLQTGELRKNGAKIRLQEKSLRVLVALAEQQGLVVTREDIKRRLWPDETFVDFETGLNTAVSKLRDALSDDAEKPRFIETIPRRGYRFIFPVEFAEGNSRRNAASPSAPAAVTSNVPDAELSRASQPGAPAALQWSEAAPDRRRPHELQLWSRVGIAAIIATIVTIFWWVTPLPDPRLTSIFPVTSNGRQDFLVRPATDGVRIFYVQRSGDHYDLMQVSVDGGEPQKINAPFPNSLIWDVSPDGAQYLLTSFAHRGEPSPLWSWPAAGGTPVKLGDLVSGSASWSSDGKMIVSHNGHDLVVANADGSAAHKLATFRQEPDSPVWAPNGKTIRFNLNDPERDTGTLWEIRPDGTGLRQLLTNWTDPSRLCCGTWTPDGRYFLFVETRYRSRLWAMREEGEWWRRSPRGPFLLAAEPVGSWGPLVGRDGKHVYFYGLDAQEDLRRLDAASHQFSTFLPLARLPVMPSFSHDGQWISYAQTLTGLLWRSRPDGSEMRQLTTPGLFVAFPRWSPDGGTIAFGVHTVGEKPNAYVISSEGGRPQLLVPGAEGLSDPDWSPDGSALVVTKLLPSSQTQDGDSMVATVDWKTRQVQDIAGSAHMYGPRWSPDGRFIAALNNTTRDLEAYDTGSKHWHVLAHGKSIGLPHWSSDGAYLYYQDMLEAGEPLLRIQINSGASETIANFQEILGTDIHRCVFSALAPNGDPIINFLRGDSDIYGAVLSLP